jgi:hypothetical protein
MLVAIISMGRPMTTKEYNHRTNSSCTHLPHGHILWNLIPWHHHQLFVVVEAFEFLHSVLVVTILEVYHLRRRRRRLMVIY